MFSTQIKNKAFKMSNMYVDSRTIHPKDWTYSNKQ